MSWLTQNVEFHGKALILRAQRAEILSANIANADTPNYKARDLDFKAAMQQSMQEGSHTLSRTHARHIELPGTAGPANVVFTESTRSSPDGNTVDPSAALSAYTENAIRFQASAEFLDGSLRGLRKAWRGD